jgi:translation initiation factor IF-2
MPKEIKNQNSIERPPVVVVMGHIDHGKSTLLDYIRKTNVVAKEAGGITQHISAYEVQHKNDKGEMKRITFLDTPGHEAFSKMRTRGAVAADIAILVVSAEDSVKQQTLEAWQTIVDAKIPYLVAINKIDKPGANIEKTKMDLAEKGVYLEGYGGDVPFVEISAKIGTGIPELLDMILLVADLAELEGNDTIPGEGVVIEAHRDPKRGISASLVIKNGKIESGMFILVGEALATTRLFENFLGEPIKKAVSSSPVRITGFDAVPEVGGVFRAYASKKEAEQAREEYKNNLQQKKSERRTETGDMKTIPLIIKTDVSGTLEAIEKEVEKLSQETISFKIINKGVGSIGEADLKQASTDKNSIIVGFNVKLDNGARELNEMLHVTIETFDIIYKMTDWLKEEMEKRRPRLSVEEATGMAKIQRCFSKTKDRQVVGGKVLSGNLVGNAQVKILRRDFEIGRGKIVELQQGKVRTKEVAEGLEFGVQIESKTELAPGDIIESFITVEK